MAGIGKYTKSLSSGDDRQDIESPEEYYDSEEYVDDGAREDSVLDNRAVTGVPLVGAAYFGGLRLMRGLSDMSFREKIDAFLVKRDILYPDPSKVVPDINRPRAPRSTVDVWFGHDEKLGPGIPGFEDPDLFGVGDRAAIERANRHRVNQEVRTVLQEYSAILNGQNSKDKQNLLNGMADVVHRNQTRSVFENSGILKDIKPESIYMLNTGEYKKVLDKLVMELEDDAAHPDVARLAQDLRKAKRTFVERMPMNNLDKPVEYANFIIHNHSLETLERFGLAGRGAITSNNANLEVQKEIWSARGRKNGLGSNALMSLNRALTDANIYDGGLSILENNGISNLTNNRTELYRTMDIWARAEGVDSVGLVDVKTIKGTPMVVGDPSSAVDHQIAIIRVTARSAADPSKKVVDFREIPLLSRFNTFAMGDNSNIYSGILHIPEHVWDPKSRTLRPGGRKGDLQTPLSRYNDVLQARVDMEVREMVEGKVMPGGTVSISRDMHRRNLQMTYGDEAQLVTNQNILSLTGGARMTFAATAVALDPMARVAKKRMKGIKQFEALKSGWKNREKVYLDIETLSEDPTAHPYAKVAYTDIYQISAIKTDVNGKIIKQKIWWVNSNKPVTDEWVKQTFDTTTSADLGRHKKWMENQIRKGGLEIHQVMNELGALLDDALLIGHYSNISDIPTIQSIVQDIQRRKDPAKRINANAYHNLMISDEGVLIDTWEMASSAMRSEGQSLELERMAKDVHGVDLASVREKYRAAFQRSIESGTGEVEVRGGTKSVLARWQERYIHSHSSLMDAHTTMASVVAMMEERNNPVAQILSNETQRDFYSKLISSTYDPELVPAALNMATLMSQQGVNNYVDELSDLFKLGGHPHTMAKGVYSAMALADYIPFGQFYTAYRRGSGHKRTNTARIHHESTNRLLNIDRNMFYPEILTDKMAELLPDSVARAHVQGHFLNGTIAYAKSRFAIEANVLVDETIQGTRTVRQSANYKVDIEKGAQHAEVIGISKSRIAATAVNLQNPGKTAGVNIWKKEINAGEYILIKYTDKDGRVQFKNHQYNEGKSAILVNDAFNPTDGSLNINRDIIQEFRSGSRGTVMGSNVTLEGMRRPFYRMGSGSSSSIDQGRKINVLASWADEGFTKYAEHGRSAEGIMGKMTGTLLQAARNGDKGAEKTLVKVLGLMPGSFLSLEGIDFNTSFANGVLNTGQTERVLTIIERRLSDQMDLQTAMNEMVNWNTLTDVYSTINEFVAEDAKMGGGIIPSYDKYSNKSKSGRREITKVRKEMKLMTEALNEDIKELDFDINELEIKQRNQKIQDRADTIQQLKTERAVLINDRKGLNKFISTHIRSGGFKFYENIRQQGTGEEFMAFVTRGQIGIGTKSPEDLMATFRFDETPTDAVGNPVGMVRLRPSSIKLIDDGLRGKNVSERGRAILLGSIRRNLGSTKYDAISMRLADVDYVLAGGKRPHGTVDLSINQLSDQLVRVNRAIESVKRATDVAQPNIWIVEDRASAHTEIVRNALTSEEAIAEVKNRMGAEGDKAILIAEQVPKTATGLLVGEADPDILFSNKKTKYSGTFLASRHPMAIKVPRHMADHATLDFNKIRKELTETMSAAKVEHVMQVLDEKFGWGKNEIRLPALGITGMGQMGEGGTVELSRLQLSAMNLATRLVEANSGASQSLGALSTHMTHFYTEMAKFVGRHSDSGLAATSFLPGIRGIVEPTEASGRIQSSVEGITSKYNDFQTTMISRAEAEAQGLGEHLLSLGMKASEVEDIMSGRTPEMKWLQREPNIYTTSVVAVQRYVVPNDQFLGSTLGLTTKQIAGAGKGIIRVTREIYKMFRGDSDGDSASFIDLTPRDIGEYREIERAMRESYNADKQSFMRSQKWRSEELVIRGGAVGSRRKKFIRQLVTEAGGTERLRYVDVDELIAGHVKGNSTVDEIKLISQQMNDLSDMDTNFYKMSTSKKSDTHLNVAAREAEDAAVAALLGSETGKVTSSVWKLRTAFDIMEDRGLGRYGQHDLFRSGEPYPELLVKSGKKMISAKNVPGLLRDTEVDARTMTGPDILAEIIDGITLSKRKLHSMAAEDLNNWNIAINPKTPVEVRVQKLLRMSTAKKGLVDNQFAQLTAELVDVFSSMEGADVMNSMYKHTVASSDPMFGEVMQYLDHLKNTKGIDATFGQELLFSENQSRTHKMQRAQLEAELRMKGTQEPMYFGKRNFRRMIADEMGTSVHSIDRRLKHVGIAAAAFAGINFMLPDQSEWWLGGESQGFGGERYDYFGDGPQLPSHVPLNIPEYSWDTFVRTSPNDGKHKSRKDFADFTYSTQPSAISTFSTASGANYSTGYYNHRSYPVTSDNMQRRQQPLNPFVGR